MSGLIGENPQGIPNNLLPYIFEVAMKKRQSLGIFGDDYSTKDGTGVRDYIDVNDLIDAHLLAYTHLRGFEIFNVGTGEGKSVLEMVKVVEMVTGENIKIEIRDRRSGDLAIAIADVTKIQKILGWKAQKSLYESVQSGWNFIKNRKK